MPHEEIAKMTGMSHAKAIKGSNFEHNPHQYRNVPNPVTLAEKEAEKLGKGAKKF